MGVRVQKHRKCTAVDHWCKGIIKEAAYVQVDENSQLFTRISQLKLGNMTQKQGIELNNIETNFSLP